MVGRKVAVFTAIETKESGGGRKRDAQIDFGAMVARDGGIAGFAASELAGLQIVEAWRRGETPPL